MEGIAKNITVQIDDHYIPTEFLVVDMGEDYDPPIILGRPFLSSTKAIIYIGTGEIHFHLPLEKVRRYFHPDFIVEEEPKKNRSRRRQHTCRQKNKIIKDGWADYEGEVSRYEDWYPEENIIPEEVPQEEEEIVIPQTSSSKSSSPKRQVWKVKSNSISTQCTTPLEAPSDVP
jgi:hypothetical protein